LSKAAAHSSRGGCCITRPRTNSQSLELATRTKNLPLAALRRFFDRLVNRRACVINPAATVKAERHSVVEGKTPEIGPEQARTLLRSMSPIRSVFATGRASPSSSPEGALNRSIDGVSHARRLSGIIGRMPAVARRASVGRTDARQVISKRMLGTCADIART
jgi:hypothetical protein